MPLPAPALDDRTFQDILDEARRRIPQYCPEWTDHNLSDPGITLLELFAWMTDMLLYRLNRVPERNYVKFLDLIGAHLEPARPAKADALFRLTAPQPEDVTIPAGTAIGTVRTETLESIAFATDRDLVVRIPQLAHVLAARGGATFHDYRAELADPRQGLGVFSDQPQENDAFYVGFANDLSGHTLAITLSSRIEGIGVDPTDPPLAWEAWDGREGRWVPLPVAEDTTGGFNRNGVVIVDTPLAAAPCPVDGRLAFWVRCRALSPRPGQPRYRRSPRVTGLRVESLGGLVPAGHAFPVTGEVLGTSDGAPGQSFRLQTLPVLPRRPGETVEVEVERGRFEPWTEVPHFGLSGEHDRHYILDDVGGTVQFGPRIRTPHGRERQCGAVPPARSEIRFSRYHSGGGVVGNVGARTLTVLKSSIPYIKWVANPEPARGGTDSEDLEHAKLRGPQLLRQQERAVTAADFEALALRASPGVTRARCRVIPGTVAANGGPSTGRASRQPAAAASNGPPGAPAGVQAAVGAPGAVRLLLVPALPESSRPLTPELLSVPAGVRQQVHAFLDERRLLTCELLLESPPYAWVTVTARLRARPGVDRGLLAERAAEALYRYLHPATGGPDGRGWPFGRELFTSEVYTLLLRLEGVDVVEDATLYPADPSAHTFGQAATRIWPGPDGLICSYEHRVEVE
jgi:predicted phage baseplate assembly protein